MNAAQAILVGSVIVGLSIIGARVIAPYEVASGTAIAWRINTITGAVELCNMSIEVGNPVTGNPKCR
jgi:hypothetical protein